MVTGLRPVCRNVEPAPGPLDKDTLTKVLANAPGIRVAPIGIVGAEAVGNGQTDFTVQFVAYVATTSARANSGGAALVMVGQILVLLPRAIWGMEDIVHPVDDATIRAETLASADILAKGVSLWAVTWRQTVRMGTDMFGEEEGITFPPVADARHDDGRFVETAVDLRK